MPSQNKAIKGEQGNSIAELERIFEQVVAVSKKLQEAKLGELCPDADLQEQVRLLLDADSSDDTLLDHALIPDTVDVSAGERIDGYHLLQEIAAGGMGVVFMAEQLEPVRRKVALKVIKPGVDTREVIARFDAERQALSMMDHPNIATVFDAGTTETGRPYFVMELVKGQSITTYCDQQKLPVRQRLNLFLSVCHAIQHAHQKGIIHRDIKPSNILVAQYDGRPLAKVIDFGIAKAVNSGLNDSSLRTGLGQIVGTFEYMSPEQSQISQQDVDTRSDIYSLGVLLYELLTGDLPFNRSRLRSVAWEEMLRIIREEDPPRPSSRLTNSSRSKSTHFKDAQSEDSLGVAGSQRTQTESAKLIRMVRGELDWIVLKAMEKDRNRRYATPNELASDIECFLNGDAVAACPPSRMYLIRKFVKRHKGAIATSAIVAASLVLGLIGTSWQSIRAQRAKEAMEASAKETMAVNEYFVNDLLDLERFESELSTGMRPDPNLRLDTVLGRALERVDERFEGQDELKANLKATLARSFSSIGRYETAATLSEEHLAYLQQERGDRAPETLHLMRQLGWIYLNQSRLVEAENLCVAALEISHEDLGAENELTLLLQNDLAMLFQEQGKFEEAKAMHLECLESKTRLLGADHPDTLGIKSNLALLYERLNRFDSAEKLHQIVLAAHRQKTRPNQMSIVASLNNLGRCYLKRGRHFEDSQQFITAVPLLKKALGISKQKLGRDYLDHPNTLRIKSYLAQAYCELRRYEDAEFLLDDLIESQRRLRGSDHATTLEAMNMLGWVYLHENRLAEAEHILSKALNDGQPLETKPRWASQVKDNLAIVYRLMGKLEKSIMQDEETLVATEKELGPNNLRTLSIKTRLGLNYLDTDRIVEGRTLLEDVFQNGEDLAGVLSIGKRISKSYLQDDNAKAAQIWTRREVEYARNKFSSDSLPLSNVLAECGSRLLRMKVWSEAEELLQECFAIRQTQLPDSWSTFNVQSLLGETLFSQRKYNEAEPLLKEAYEKLKQFQGQSQTLPSPFKAKLSSARERLISLYEATGEAQQAAERRTEREDL